MKIKLITDAASDLQPADHTDIDVVEFFIYDATANKELHVKSVDELYHAMIESPQNTFKTACPTIDTYYQKFVDNHKNGCATICVCITSKFSGSFNSATMAKRQAEEEYPDAKITVIDSQGNSALQGLLVLEISNMIKDGLKYEDILTKANQLIPTGKIMFTVANVEYLKKGGRIGGVSAFVATAFNLKPIIVMREGDIGLGGIAFGVKRTLAKVLELVKSHFTKAEEKLEDYNFMVGYSSDKSVGEGLTDQASQFLQIKKEEILFKQITASTAVHTGPNTVGIAFIKKHAKL